MWAFQLFLGVFFCMVGWEFGCSNQPNKPNDPLFWMEIKNPNISLPAGERTKIDVVLHLPDQGGPFYIGCQGMLGQDIFSMMDCYRTAVLTYPDDRSEVTLSIHVDENVPPMTTTIKIVAVYMDQTQVLPVTVTVVDNHISPKESPVPLLRRPITTSEIDLVSGVGVDEEGGSYAAGQTTGAFFSKKNAGGIDAFLIKYRSNGSLEWLTQFGTKGSDVISGMVVDKDKQVYVVGYTYDAFPSKTSAGISDVFIAKFDSMGYQVWLKQFGTSSIDKGMALCLDQTGHLFVAGTTEGSFPNHTNLGFSDAFLSKFSSDGDHVWTKSFGSDGTESVTSIHCMESGDIVLAGSTDGQLPFQKLQGRQDSMLARYDAEGTQRFLTQFGSKEDERITGVTSDRGTIYVVGHERWNSFLMQIGNAGSVEKGKWFYNDSQILAVTAFDGMLFYAGTIKNFGGQAFFGWTDPKKDVFGFDQDLFGFYRFETHSQDFGTSLSVSKDRIYLGGTIRNWDENMGWLPTDGFLYRSGRIDR